MIPIAPPPPPQVLAASQSVSVDSWTSPRTAGGSDVAVGGGGGGGGQSHQRDWLSGRRPAEDGRRTGRGAEERPLDPSGGGGESAPPTPLPPPQKVGSAPLWRINYVVESRTASPPSTLSRPPQDKWTWRGLSPPTPPTPPRPPRPSNQEVAGQLGEQRGAASVPPPPSAGRREPGPALGRQRLPSMLCSCGLDVALMLAAANG